MRSSLFPQIEDDREIAANKVPHCSDSIRVTLDSGATIATCKRLEHLHDVRRVTPIRVRVANNQAIELDRMGTLRLRTTDGSKTITVPDVYYWPDCPVNLISVGSLTRHKTKEVVFGADAAIIRKAGGNHETILSVPKRGRLYVIDMIVVPHTGTQGELHTAAPVINVRNDEHRAQAERLQLWHHRLAHLGASSLEKLVRSKSVSGLGELSSLDLSAVLKNAGICHGCAVGKATRKAFSRLNSGEPASEILDRLHVDVKGPINVPTLSGMRFLLGLTDEKSRRTWGYLMKNKSEAPQLIIHLITQLRIETGKLLRVFHTDNGGEFVNATLHTFFNREGVRYPPPLQGAES